MQDVRWKLALKSTGPGGFWCPCCGPAPGWRKGFFKIIKKRERRLVQEEINRELNTDYEFPELWDD